MANHIAHHRAGAKGSQTKGAPDDAPGGAHSSGGTAIRRPSREKLSAWWFPDLEGPDLSTEVIPGQHEALKLLNGLSIAELFAEESGDDLDDDAADLTPAPDDPPGSKEAQPQSATAG